MFFYKTLHIRILEESNNLQILNNEYVTIFFFLFFC